MEITPSRPLYKMQFIKKRKEFGEIRKLTEKDSNEGLFEIKTISDLMYNSYIKKRTLEIGLQGANTTSEVASQTQWYRRMNTFTETVKENLNLEVEDNTLTSLIKNYEVINELESALQQNEMIDVFQDDFAVLPHEELASNDSTKVNYDPADIRSLQYHLCNGKRVSCIRLMPKTSEMK